MGSNQFSVTTSIQTEIVTIFHPDNPRLQYDDVVLPMNVLETDEGTGGVLCSFDLELGGGSGGPALGAVSADLWNRLIGHINRKSTDVMWKQASSGVEYTGDIQACDVCAVSKSEHQAHPKQATYDGQRAFQLVTVVTMAPISPHALGGFNYWYVTKFVDQHTTLKDTFS